MDFFSLKDFCSSARASPRNDPRSSSQAVSLPPAETKQLLSRSSSPTDLQERIEERESNVKDRKKCEEVFCASVNILTALSTHLWPARASYSFPANHAPPTRLWLIVSNPDLSPAIAPAATPVVGTQSLLSSTHTKKQIKG